MRDEDLRDQLLDSVRALRSLPAPGMGVLRRRVRRRRIRTGAACFALSAVVGTGAVFAAGTKLGGAGQHPAGGASPSSTPTVGPLPQGWRPAGPALAPDADVTAAPYYVTLDQTGYVPLNFSGRGYAIVADEFTGNAVATIVDPDGPVSFTAVAAAGDDRTFFLATEFTASSVAIYELRLGADGRPVSFTRAYTTRGHASIDQLAVSQDATRLAYVTSKGIEVVSLPGGSSHLVPCPSDTISGMSWIGDRTLAYVQHLDSAHTFFRMVNVEPGPVRQIVPVPSVSYPLIASDASVVVGTVVTGGKENPVAAVEEFSGSTGRLVARLTPWTGESGMGSSCLPLWIDSSGTHGVVECGGQAFTFAGDRSSRTDVHVPRANFSVPPDWLIAW